MEIQTPSGSGSMDPVAQMFFAEMKRERRNMWAILAVFFVLLFTMFVYNMLRVGGVAEDARREKFRNVGEQSVSMSALRTQNNEAAVAQWQAANERMAAARDIGAQLKASKQSPQALIGDAVKYAKNHFLGRPLNMSTAAVVEVASGASLPKSRKALLNAALYDWRSNKEKMSKGEQAAERNTLELLKKDLLSDRQLAFYGHAADAAYYFRRGSSDDVYMSKDVCDKLIPAATLALSDPNVPERPDPEASGTINLNYWRGQCLRRGAKPAEALEDFKMMMMVADSEGFPETDPLKYGAFHGIAMATTALLDQSEDTDAQVSDAIAKLRAAGGYRKSAGGNTAIGEISSTANIGLLIMRGKSPERYVEALEHTEEIDRQQSSTWNLVARLVAARAVQRDGLPNSFVSEKLKARDAELHQKYSNGGLKDIVFHTLAEIAWQKEGTLPVAELTNLLNEPDRPVLTKEIVACFGKRDACYEAHAREF